MASALTRIFFRKGQFAVLLTQPYFNNSRLDNTQNTGGSPIMWIFGTVQKRLHYRNLFIAFQVFLSYNAAHNNRIRGKSALQENKVMREPLYWQ